MLEIWIPGKPVAQGRVRFARRGKHTTAYDPEQSATYKNWVKCNILDANVKMFEPDVPLYFCISVILARPKSVKRRQPTCKPDLDNYIKILSDACNGFIFEDQQIVAISARKEYCNDANNQGVWLRVYEDKEDK